MRLACLLAFAAALSLSLSAGAAAPDDRDRASRDQVAPLATIGFIDARGDRPLDLVFRYWRDVHGVLAARIEGIEQYWQHHLGPPDPVLWPETPGVARAPEPHLTLEGFAEVTFRTPEVGAAMAEDPAARRLQQDERNVFRGTFLHSTAPGNTVTLKDTRASNTPQGDDGLYRAILLLRQARGSESDGFRAFVRDRLAPALAADPDAIKLRLHLFEPYTGAWDTPGVENALAVDESWQGWLELVFPDRARAAAALRSAAVSEVLTEAPDRLAAVHVYPVAQVWTPVYRNRPTHIGLRGYPAYETIQAVGAANQKTLPVLQLLFGADTALPPAE
jgi:hypothetical protein